MLASHAAIVAQRTNQRMFIQEWEWLLSNGLTLDELAQGAEVLGLMRKGRFTGFFQDLVGMPLRQAEQPLKHTDSLDAPVLKHGGRPGSGLRSIALAFVSSQVEPRSIPLIFSAGRCFP